MIFSYFEYVDTGDETTSFDVRKQIVTWDSKTFIYSLNSQMLEDSFNISFFDQLLRREFFVYFI